MLCFVKRKTEYELRISDWSSDVCSSDLERDGVLRSSGLEHVQVAKLTLRKRRRGNIAAGHRGPSDDAGAARSMRVLCRFRITGAWSASRPVSRRARPLSRGDSNKIGRAHV